MPNIIYKYTVPHSFGIEEKITLPQFAEFLSVQRQEGMGLVMWFQADPTMPAEDRFFILQPTGQAFDETNLSYLGTAQWKPSVTETMVGHLFERL